MYLLIYVFRNVVDYVLLEDGGCLISRKGGKSVHKKFYSIASGETLRDHYTRNIHHMLNRLHVKKGAGTVSISPREKFPFSF